VSPGADVDSDERENLSLAGKVMPKNTHLLSTYVRVIWFQSRVEMTEIFHWKQMTDTFVCMNTWHEYM